MLSPNIADECLGVFLLGEENMRLRIGGKLALPLEIILQSLPENLRMVRPNLEHQTDLLGVVNREGSRLSGLILESEMMPEFSKWICGIKRLHNIDVQLSISVICDLIDFQDQAFVEFYPRDFVEKIPYQMKLIKPDRCYEFLDWCPECQSCKAIQISDLSVKIERGPLFKEMNDFMYVSPNTWAVTERVRDILNERGVLVRPFKNHTSIWQLDVRDFCSVDIEQFPLSDAEKCSTCGKTKNLGREWKYQDEYGLNESGIRVQMPYQPVTFSSKTLNREAEICCSFERIGFSALKPKPFSIKHAVESLSGQTPIFFMRVSLLKTFLEHQISGLAYCAAISQ
ncbi:MAG: hypothetical protein KIS92_19195 [Planctomycetota bacterium]|nr:hypothetical protein [Planctomycetota bacterium]